MNFEENNFTNVFLIQNQSIRLLEEKIPISIEDVIEISSTKIIVIAKNKLICFELINIEYQEIKRIDNIDSIKKISHSNYLFCAFNQKNKIKLFDCNTLELINVLHEKCYDICFLNKNNFITVISFSNVSILKLFDLKKFKKLDDFYHPHDAYMNKLIKIGNKGYFIVGNQSNVSGPSIYKIYNNKINFVKTIYKWHLIPFTSWIFFNKTIFIGGVNRISIYKLDI